MKNKKKIELKFSEKGIRQMAELEPDCGVLAISPEIYAESQLNELAKAYAEEHGTEYLSSLMERCFKAGYLSAKGKKGN
jgi:hypothetical protein